MDNNNNNNFNNMPPDYNNYNNDSMTVGEWLLTIFITNLPCVGLIMLFVWGFGEGNESRSKYCKAMLLWMLIATVVVVIIYAIVIGAGISAFNRRYY